MLVFGYYKKPKSGSAALPSRTKVEALGSGGQLIQKPASWREPNWHVNQLDVKSNRETCRIAVMCGPDCNLSKWH